MEYTIGKRTAQLHFGLDFMEAINTLSGMTQGDVNIGAGAVLEQQRLEMGDLTALGRVIYAATAGLSPRPSFEQVKTQVEKLDSDEAADAVLNEVLEAMKASFPLQFQLHKMEKMAKAQK